jgi:hypothetical protein
MALGLYDGGQIHIQRLRIFHDLGLSEGRYFMITEVIVGAEVKRLRMKLL